MGFADGVEEPKRSTQSSPRPSQDQGVLLAQPLARGGELCAGVGGGEGNLEGETGMETEAPGAELPIFHLPESRWGSEHPVPRWDSPGAGGYSWPKR